MKERMMPTEEQLLELEKYFVPETDIYFFRNRPNDIDSVITLEQFKKQCMLPILCMRHFMNIGMF